MTARSPQITPAQRQLEALQMRELQQQEREDNVRSAEVVRQQRRMLFGTMGHNVFAEPGAALPPAQTSGGTVRPSLIEPAITAMTREERLANLAGGFNAGTANRMKALLGAFRPPA